MSAQVVLYSKCCSFVWAALETVMKLHYIPLFSSVGIGCVVAVLSVVGMAHSTLSSRHLSERVQDLSVSPLDPNLVIYGYLI